MSNWQQLHLNCDKDMLEALSDVLLELGAVSVTWQNANNELLFEPTPGEHPLWDNILLTALFDSEADIDAVLKQVKLGFGEYIKSHELSSLADKNWQLAWMDHYQPVKISPHLWICPSWETPPDSTALNIMLDPGLAFGTGTHPTTAMCLQFLENNIEPGKTVIDFGCGSGILAIAALKLGAEKVIATDIDPQALEVTTDNASKNQVSLNRLITCLPDAVSDIKSDILVANILANPLIELAPTLAKLIKINGLLAVSGLLEEQAGSVKRAFEPWFKLNHIQQDKQWVLLDFIRINT